MLTAYRVLLYIHVLLAAATMLVFWVPVVTAKGGAAHRTWGRRCLRMLRWTLRTAVVLAIAMLVEPVATHPPQETFAFPRQQLEHAGEVRRLATFLLFFAVITWTAQRQALLALRTRHGPVRPPRADFAWNMLLRMGGGGVFAVGVIGKDLVLLLSGPVGVLTGIAHLVMLVRPPVHPAAWLVRHLAAITLVGVALHTAFLVFGIGRRLPDDVMSGPWALVPWLAPAVIGVAAAAAGARRFVRRHGDLPGAPAAAPPLGPDADPATVDARDPGHVEAS